MLKNKIAFFDAKLYDQKSFDEINKKFGFKITYYSEHLNRNTVKFTKGFDVVCVFVNDTVDSIVVKELIKNGVKLIALRCAGYNNVDLKSVFNNIHVVRVPAYSPYAVAEHAAALILTLNRKTHKAYSRVRDGNFSINGFLGVDLFGKTAGIVGVGKIGKCLVSILKGFGMNVILYDLSPDNVYAKKSGTKFVSLDKLYRESDIISLHCPLTPQTFHMINSKSISKMKNGVMIINTGRGKLIDTKALIEGLKKGKIGAAGLDVYEEESEYFFEDFSNSMIADDILARLMTFPNVLVTSHQAFFTKEALSNIAETTLNNVKAYFKEGVLENEVCYKCNKSCRRKKGKACF